MIGRGHGGTSTIDKIGFSLPIEVFSEDLCQGRDVMIVWDGLREEREEVRRSIEK